MNKLLRIVGITNFSLFLLLLSSPDILSQNITNLSDEFLEGLPPSVREQIEVQNEVNAEKEIEDLFQSDTSIEKNKVILQKLKDQLIALEKRFDDQDDIEDGLDRFGAAFFTTIQSSQSANSQCNFVCSWRHRATRPVEDEGNRHLYDDYRYQER